MLKKVSTSEISNAFQIIGQDYMLITAADERGVNTMTASWGGIGHMWGYDSSFIVVRPSRYTYEFIEKSNLYTLSFFGGEQKKALGICGTKSGRDCDKIKEAGLTPTPLEGTYGFEEAKIILICQKMFYQDINPNNFLLPEIDEKWYKGKDYHRLYIGKIISSYIQ